MFKIIGIILYLCHSHASWAQDTLKANQAKGGEAGWKAPKQLSFSAGEAKKTCRRYEGRYISYYGKVFKVENCLRRELDGESLDALGKKKIAVQTVENDVIIMLGQGEPIFANKLSYSCKKLSQRYIISPTGEMYLMEDCKLRVFPDYETYDEHVKKHKLNRSILELRSEEFSSFQLGKPMPTILDSIYNQESIIEHEVDMIPLAEACAGIEGKYISYYSKIYKIEKCNKREVLDDRVVRNIGRKKKIKEISSEQWISLPDGDPMEK